jgi:uncharacterized protein YycO
MTMRKRNQLLILASVLATGMLFISPFAAYAQIDGDGGTTLELEVPLLIVVIASAIGASLNVLRGYFADETPNKTFSAQKFISALIIAIMAGITVAVTLPLEATGIVGLIIAGLMAGFGADFALSRGKK